MYGWLAPVFGILLLCSAGFAAAGTLTKVTIVEDATEGMASVTVKIGDKAAVTTNCPKNNHTFCGGLSFFPEGIDDVGVTIPIQFPGDSDSFKIGFGGPNIGHFISDFLSDKADKSPAETGETAEIGPTIAGQVAGDTITFIITSPAECGSDNRLPGPRLQACTPEISEPSTDFIFGTALLGLLALGWRRGKKTSCGFLDA